MRSFLTCLFVSILLAACDDGATETPPTREPAGGGEAPPAPARAPEAPPEPAAPEPLAVPEGRRQLVLGAAHGCLLGEDGGVGCWGSNQFGQLGDPSLERGPSAMRSERAPVEGLQDVVRLAAGAFHTCALRASGTVACWGHGGFGQLGGGEGEDRATPQQVELGSPAVGLAAGEGHSCALLADRTVRCWGRNHLGQLGDGTLEPTEGAVAVQGLEDTAAIVAGRDHTCARAARGAVHCWGAAFEGQLGDGERGGETDRRETPVEVPGIEAISLSAGAAHTCALDGEGVLRCWGRNDAGQVGDGAGGDPEDVTPSPARVPELSDVAEVAAGGSHTCARLEDGGVRCWGFNAFGQLGDGTETLREAPTPVDGLDDAVQIAAGARFGCALRDGGALVCWGRNDRGQLGDGTTEDRAEPVAAGTEVGAVVE